MPYPNFKVGAKAVVQSDGFRESDIDHRSSGHLDLTTTQKMRDIGTKARDHWRGFGLLTET